MNANPFFRASLLALAAAGLVAGCGGDDSDNATVPSAPTAAVPTAQSVNPSTTKAPGGKDNGDDSKTPVPTPGENANPEFTAAPDAPKTQARITVTAEGIEVSPDPLPRNQKAKVSLTGGGLGKNAIVQILEGDTIIVSARLLKEPVRFETETISETVTILVKGTKKVRERKKVVRVR